MGQKIVKLLKQSLDRCKRQSFAVEEKTTICGKMIVGGKWSIFVAYVDKNISRCEQEEQATQILRKYGHLDSIEFYPPC